VLEVAIMVVAGGIILIAFRNYDDIDSRKLTKMKG
jgi:NADH:ubiquinone oxidoreductase subunit K